MPCTAAERPRTAADAAAVGLWYDPDKGTRWEGLATVLPRFRSAPVAKVTLSGRFRAADARATAASAAVQKAKRRNDRKAARAGAPDWRSKPRGFRAGIAGLLAALTAA